MYTHGQKMEVYMEAYGDLNKKDILRCSFCGKSQHEVEKLIAGPAVFICNECVELSTDIIFREKMSARSALQASDEELPKRQWDTAKVERTLAVLAFSFSEQKVLEIVLPTAHIRSLVHDLCEEVANELGFREVQKNESEEESV